MDIAADGKIFEVDFEGTCDLFLSDLLEEKQD